MRTCSLAFLALLAPAPAFATSGGVVGYSGKGGVYCTACHGVGAGTVPTVAIEGPATLTSGQVATYTVRITGGPGTRGGTNISASSAAVGLAAGVGMVLEGGELRHTAPKTFAGGNTSWSFFVTAPPTAGTFTLYAAGNSCNGAGSGGDRSATTTRAITVTAANQPPAIASAPTVAVSSSTTRTLAVVATDDGALTALSYTWEATTAPQPVTFSVNGDSAARTTVATFTRAGDYTFVVTVRDAGGLTAVRTLDVTVAPVVVAANVTPATAGVPAAATQQFTAVATDQFGATLSPAPAWTWRVSGGGTVSAAGLFTAGTTLGGPHTVTATAGGQSATAQVTIANGTPPLISGTPAVTPSPVTGRTAALTVTATDDGGEPALSYTWSASGPAPVTFSANASNAAKTATATFARSGAYSLNVVVRDAAGLTDSASVTVTVVATATAVSVTPAMSTVPRGGRLQLDAAAVDQFGQPLVAMPVITWSISGGGTITATGQVTAGAVTGGPHTVTATAGALSGTATMLVSSGGPPALVRAPQASPAQVQGRTTLLTVLATDDTGEANLIYHWDSTGPGEVLFSDDDTNDGKSSVATFTRAGTYQLKVTVEDPSKAEVSASVMVVVAQSLTGISISPGAVVVQPLASQQFAARVFDQFGNLQTQPPELEWSVSAGGSIDASGMFVATAEGGPWAVRAKTPSGLRASAELVVGVARDLVPPSVTIVSHQSSATLAGKVELFARASDEGEVSEVIFKIGETEVGPGVKGESGDFSVQLQTLAFPNGSYPLVAVAMDAAGNRARSESVTVIVDNRGSELTGEYAGCSSSGGQTALIAAMLLAFWLLRRRNGGHAPLLQIGPAAALRATRSPSSLGRFFHSPWHSRCTAGRRTRNSQPQVNLMVKRALTHFAVAAALMAPAIASAQATPESRERCATRLSAAILAQPPSTALLAATDPQATVDAMLTSTAFRERFSRFINAKMNGDPGATPAEDASYYLAKYVLENDRPWRELFNGQYQVSAGATATADAVVTADTNGLGYFRSRPWMIRYAGNEIDGYRIVAAYRILNNVLGVKLVAAVNTDGIDANGRRSASCSGCHYNNTFGLDYVAKILSRKFGEGDAMTFGPPTEGPQPLLGGQMISSDAQLVNTMVASGDFRFNACRTAMEYLYARAEFKCEGPVFDACMTAFQSAGTMTSALGAIAKAPGFCQ